jgi:hypothetical protein
MSFESHLPIVISNYLVESRRWAGLPRGRYGLASALSVGTGGVCQSSRLQGKQLLQECQIAVDISASRLLGGGGFQLLAQPCHHETRGKFGTGRSVQNIGSSNADGRNVTTFVHPKGGSSGGIKGWLCRNA